MALEGGPKSRSPYGERGLKSRNRSQNQSTGCRSPYGERGLKSHRVDRLKCLGSRSPYGERGLKFHVSDAVLHVAPVAPLTGSVD